MGTQSTTQFKLRLYVITGDVNSKLAEENLKRFCDDNPVGIYDIETVDVLEAPERAGEDGVYAVPVLVKLLPLPVRKIIGNLGHPENVKRALGIE